MSRVEAEKEYNNYRWYANDVLNESLGIFSRAWAEDVISKDWEVGFKDFCDIKGIVVE